ncbi:MAG: DUF1385 domain-containing protein [Pyramidobacter sp.]|jgi:uncharacterized protein YqhQ
MTVLFKMKRACALVFAALAAEERPAPMPVGGQAVIEGVLMKGYSRWGLAVRKENGEIVTENWPVSAWGGRWAKIPVVRGFVNMVDMLRQGFKALSRSAELSLGDEEEMTTKDVILTALVAAALVIGLFVALPLWIADLLKSSAGLSPLGANVAEGCVRGLVFIAYLAAIGLWKDMARILAYHGAEHKTINAYEAGEAVTVENVMKHSRLHPRCGTSFLLIVVIVSIIVFSLAGSGSALRRIVLRVLLIPVVVGFSYEFIRAMWRLGTVGRCVMALPMTLQYLTTREPTAEQAEVGIRALEEALGKKFDSETSEETL